MWHRVNLQWPFHNILLKGFQEVYVTQHILHLFTYFSNLTHFSIFSPQRIYAHTMSHIQKYAHCRHKHSFPSLHHIAFTLRFCHLQCHWRAHCLFNTMLNKFSLPSNFLCHTKLFLENTVKCRLTNGDTIWEMSRYAVLSSCECLRVYLHKPR